MKKENTTKAVKSTKSVNATVKATSATSATKARKVNNVVAAKVFNGPDLTKKDNKRLATQFDAIFKYMKDSKFRTLQQISTKLGYPESSVSAQLRHMRKPKFGSHTVNRKRICGTYYYQLIVNK